MATIEQNCSAGSEAFSLEYHRNTPDVSIRTDLESLLGEYDFAVPLYKWELLYTSDEFGISHLVSPYDHEPMTVKCQRAIQKRKNVWKNTSREEAEYECARSLETQLNTASTGDMVFWTSPPGPCEDGYGDYGFFFVGQISTKENESAHKRISITTIRIDNQSVTQCNEALSVLTGKSIYFNTAEDCIKNPKIISSVNEDRVQYVMSEIFHFVPDEKCQKLFSDVIQIIKPQIDSFIHLIQYGASRKEIQRGLWALRNYTISLRTMAERSFDDIMVIPFETLVCRFGTQPPPVIAGSCGSTGSKNIFKSSSIFNSLSSFIDLFSSGSSENFICPHCHEESTPPVGDQCPKCSFTKEEAKQQGIITC